MLVLAGGRLGRAYTIVVVPGTWRRGRPNRISRSRLSIRRPAAWASTVQATAVTGPAVHATAIFQKRPGILHGTAGPHVYTGHDAKGRAVAGGRTVDATSFKVCRLAGQHVQEIAF